MHKHTARQEPDQSFTFLRDGNVCQCPKVVFPMPQQGMGGMTMLPLKFPCSTNCPFAQIQKMGEKDEYVITCEGQKQSFILSEIKMQDPKNPSKIVPLMPGVNK